jgi:hypothetical protein
MTTIEARVPTQTKRATPSTSAKSKANRKAPAGQGAEVESEAREDLHTARVTKHDSVLTLLSRREGVTISEMM